MWMILALTSALCLGVYDIFKKISLRDNNIPLVLLLNTLFGTLIMSPVIIGGLSHGYWGLGGTITGHIHIIIKAIIVLSSWALGYAAIKHLPLTIQGPINASRPVMVLLGALIIFGEKLNALQWAGMLLGFCSLYMISRIGSREGFSLRSSRWLWMSIAATALGAVSALYDKYLLTLYQPTEVQAWYTLYQLIIMGAAVTFLFRLFPSSTGGAFHWSWAIPCISVFITIADLAYFYALSLPGAMISIVSMARRASVIVPFLYGVLILHERNIKAKSADLLLLLASLLFLVLGSR